MQDPIKRIRKIIKEVEEYGKIVEMAAAFPAKVSADANLMPPQKAKLISDQKKALDKCGKNLINVLAAVRGHKLEAEVTLNELYAYREILSDEAYKKMGDVASVEGGKTRVVQAKSYSGHANSGVNDHIKEAFKQLFGSKGEIPAAGAKLTVLVQISSGKCTWPFTKQMYERGMMDVRRFKEKTTYANASFADSDVTTYVKEARDASLAHRKNLSKKRQADGKANDEWARLNAFLKGLNRSTVQLIVVYKKQFGIDPTDKNSPKAVMDRAKGQAVNKLTVPIVMTESGNINIGSVTVI